MPFLPPNQQRQSTEGNKERLQWEGFAESEGFKSVMKVFCLKNIIIISATVSGINDHNYKILLRSTVD